MFMLAFWGLDLMSSLACSESTLAYTIKGQDARSLCSESMFLFEPVQSRCFRLRIGVSIDVNDVILAGKFGITVWRPCPPMGGLSVRGCCMCALACSQIQLVVGWAWAWAGRVGPENGELRAYVWAS